MKLIIKILIVLFIAGVSTFESNAQTPKYQQPVLISSAGQSADIVLAGMLFKKLKLEYKTANLAKESNLEGIKTLVIVPGFSSKGLGAAGISREDEMKRVKELINSAKKKKIQIVMLHIGGNARRGNQSDDFNKLVAESSSYMIVVSQGDEDKFFSKISAKTKTPIKLIDKIAQASEPINQLFK
ncbi:MAG TPA: DUF6305 family protein [Ignavibacteriaceae bacterium]